MGSVDVNVPAVDLAGFDSLLQRRHSCRGFLPQPVPRQIIRQILATAQRTASWCNAQPWHVHLISGAPLEALRQRTDLPGCRTAFVPHRSWTGRGNIAASIRSGGANADGTSIAPSAFRRATAKPPQGKPARISGYSVRRTWRLSATMRPWAPTGSWTAAPGFQTSCWQLRRQASARFAQAALASWPDLLRKHLDIGAERHIVCGISFGYEDTAHPANNFRTSRAPIEETATFVG